MDAKFDRSQYAAGITECVSFPAGEKRPQSASATACAPVTSPG